MDERTNEDIVGLVALARKQQALAQAAVESLAATSAGLEKQLFGLRATIPEVQEAAERGAQQASGKAFVGVAEAAAKAMDTASQPSIARLEKTLQAAVALEGQLRRAVAWFTWRLAARIAAIFGTGVLVLWLLGWVTISRYQEEREALVLEVEQLRAQAARLKVVDCELHGGPKGRKCLPITDKVYGEENSKTFYYPVW